MFRKGYNAEEAAQLCAKQKAEKAEAAPKIKKTRRGKLNPEGIAQCLIAKVNAAETVTKDAMTLWVTECINAKPVASTYKKFMKSCMKEQGEPKNLGQNGRFVKVCQVKWKETQAQATGVTGA